MTLISAQQQYIDAFRAQVQAVRGPAGLLEDSNKAIVAAVRERYPDWQLEMLIPINAQAVATELREATNQ